MDNELQWIVGLLHDLYDCDNVYSQIDVEQIVDLIAAVDIVYGIHAHNGNLVINFISLSWNRYSDAQKAIHLFKGWGLSDKMIQELKQFVKNKDYAEAQSIMKSSIINALPTQYKRLAGRIQFYPTMSQAVLYMPV